MQSIQDRVESVRSRQQRLWMWQAASIGLLLGGIVGCGLVAASVAGIESLSLLLVASIVVAFPVIGLLIGFIVPCRSRDAAVAIDREYRLKDRVVTAFNFLQQSDPSPLQQLQLGDAQSHVSDVSPARVVPYRAPRTWRWGLVLSVVALVAAFVSGPRKSLDAAVVQDEVVLSQAFRMEDGLEELKEFNEESADPEIEELLKQLAEKVEELKLPGVDPKEALAKLSEMETALQAKQEQLADPSTEAALQDIGEALSLAEPFQAAGQAMAEGEMEKAAEELAKLELPEIDRQTERALTEKLEQAKQNSSPGSQRKLREATGKISAGLTQGDRSKFKDGVEGLAGECKKQGRRKKLSDLLRKQCNCLSECKSQCESACKSQADSKKPGGKSWGLGRSGNDPGDKTAKLKTGPQMQIKGIESAGGDVDVETTSAPEQQQDAVRQYREKVDKYEQISESVLDSEPIPLGHRQTIRRYFEMIRPQGDETSEVFDELSKE